MVPLCSFIEFDAAIGDIYGYDVINHYVTDHYVYYTLPCFVCRRQRGDTHFQHHSSRGWISHGSCYCRYGCCYRRTCTQKQVIFYMSFLKLDMNTSSSFSLINYVVVT